MHKHKQGWALFFYPARFKSCLFFKFLLIQCSLGLSPPPDVNIIILIYLFIEHVLFILMYLHKCKMHVTMSVELKVYLFIWSHNLRFAMFLSLSPNSLYRQTTDCTEGGGLTREHCIFKTLFGSTLKTLFFSKNIMTSPRLPLVKTQRSFLSGSSELSGF